jgi:hypothetical protein
MILQQDHNALIKLNRELSGEERLMAFFHHSQLLCQLSLVKKADKSQGADRLTDNLSE